MHTSGYGVKAGYVDGGMLDNILGERVGTVTSFKASAGFKRFEIVENRFKEDWC